MTCLWCCAIIALTWCSAWSAEVDLHPDDEDLKGQIGTLRNTIKVLSDEWEKWNVLFVTSLEPRITSTASTLSSIDSNIHNLQERAHVWDTFQLHVAAWNEQLATMDRKIDILNKAVEQIAGIDTKINTILSDEYKLDKLTKMINTLLETTIGMDNSLKSKQHCASSKETSLFEEFAARGILSSLKLMERKIDHLMSIRQSGCKQTAPTVDVLPKNTEVLLNDIASKVDIIFDSMSKFNDIDYSEEYIDVKDLEGSGALPNRPGKHLVRSVDHRLKEMYEKMNSLNGNIVSLLRQTKTVTSQEDYVTKIIQSVSINQSKNFNQILDGYFRKDIPYWNKIAKTLKETCFIIQRDDVESTTKALEVTQTQGNTTTDIFLTTFCSNLENDKPSGIYSILKNSQGNFLKERFFNKQFCKRANEHYWTVIQRRDNYTIQQDFNVSWTAYKVGFGDLEKDFWMGNNFLARISVDTNLTLRIELEDFDGNTAWAEYEKFAVNGEEQQFTLTVGGYSGNASDALSSHSGSAFSTYDRKNDLAPECCPCAVSYGGGWWFNRCFESNLNGIYFKKPLSNEYFRGVIWEHWRGNYSLKRTEMMVRLRGHSEGPNVEEP